MTQRGRAIIELYSRAEVKNDHKGLRSTMESLSMAGNGGDDCGDPVVI